VARRSIRLWGLLGSCLALGVAACSSVEPHYLASAEPTSALPSGSTLTEKAQTNFEHGEFGLAADNFAKAVEVDPVNAEAWLGLAASYDHIRRFDLADKAYTKVQSLIGSTPSVLNNLGYSYYLRGDLEKSKSTLAAAYRGDRHNPYILSNIELLNEKLTSLGKEPLHLN